MFMTAKLKKKNSKSYLTVLQFKYNILFYGVWSVLAPENKNSQLATKFKTKKIIFLYDLFSSSGLLFTSLPFDKKETYRQNTQTAFLWRCFLNAIQRVNEEKKSAKMYYPLFRKREYTQDNIWKPKNNTKYY